MFCSVDFVRKLFVCDAGSSEARRRDGEHRHLHGDGSGQEESQRQTGHRTRFDEGPHVEVIFETLLIEF